MQKKDRKCRFETRISPVICCNAYFSGALAKLFQKIVFLYFLRLHYVHLLYLVLYLFSVWCAISLLFLCTIFVVERGIKQYRHLTWLIYWHFTFFVQKHDKMICIHCTGAILVSLALKKKKKEGLTHICERLVGFENLPPPPQWNVKISQCIQRMISRGRIRLFILT